MSEKTFFSKLKKALNAVSFGEEPELTIIKAVNTEERKCVEIVYKPDVKDAHGEWMTASTIKKAEESYQRNEVVPNLFHVTPTNKFKITKSWVLDEDVKFEGREEIVKAGTWLAETFYEDEALWELKKSRELGGLSLGGYGEVNPTTGEITKVCFSKEEFLKLKDEEANK